TISSLSIGNYNATITDYFGCICHTSNYEISSPPPIDMMGYTTEDRCHHSLGSITTTVSGGVEPYTFEWENLDFTSPNLTQLEAGIYTCTITDANGCIQLFQDTIYDKTIIAFIDSISPSSCGKNNGWISIHCENGVGPIQYNWFEITDFMENRAFNIAPGVYTVIVSDNLCSDTLQFVIEESGYPTACFETFPSNSFEINSTIQFLNCSDGDVNWVWNFGDYSISYVENPSHEYQFGGTYTIELIVNNEFGCLDSISKTIEIKEFDIFIPNSFTPNGDNLNDIFLPIFKSEDLENYHFEIFNRWGELIFYSNEIKHGWDGKFKGELVPFNSTYTYIIRYKNSDGKSIQKTGSIHVIQ
ncbi:MAG: hypothetical protein CVU04_05995, partial [Bacteroidetes bacterium HGW-Bacteroidetes-20]